MTQDAENPGAGSRPEAAAAEVSVLDHALWSRFSEDREAADFAKVWLALQVRLLEQVTQGVVVLEAPDGGGFVPVATWPPESAPTQDLANAVEQALERETSVSIADQIVSAPIMVDGDVMGAVALSRSVRDSAATLGLLRQLQWGTGWLAAAVRRGLMEHHERNSASMKGVLDVLGAVLDARSLESASLAAGNLAARRMGCAQVAVGLQRTRRMRLQTLSDVAEFRLNTNRTQKLEAVLSEAFVQEGTVLYPPREGQAFVVARAHKELADTISVGDILTVPLFAQDRVIGALSFQKPASEVFSATDMLLAEGIGAALGPIFAEKIAAERGVLAHGLSAAKTQVSRVLGPGYLGRKLALLSLVALTVFFSFAKGDFRVRADAEVEGLIVRAMTASFDGHIKDALVKAGDIVSQSDVMARLDDRDLQMEMLRWQTELSRYLGEYDKALAERDAPEVRIAAANAEQSRAKIDLVQLQLDRSAILAPFDGIVIEGDLSQSIGTAVRRGDALFKIAPLDSYRVTLEVEDRDLDEIQVGQGGALVLASLPSEQYAFEVVQITPSMQAREGRNFALVEAKLLEWSDQIRPGMRGVAKVSVEERLLIRNWAQPVIDWFRLAIWKWTP